ncbi:MAG: hypothetical protein J7501_12595 [Bdellovibrio sp.]|nr:hypothetical protein [Bdellovibrio sp.]
MKFIFVAVAMLFLVACSTTPSKTTTYTSPPAVAGPDQGNSQIDYQAIQRALHMERSSEELGYAEKSFNTCEMGYGYSRNKDCRKAFLVVLNVRLMCRDSEGTISTVLTEADVAPIAGQNIRWNLKATSGTFQTDGLGYGQILTISPRSERKERLKLAAGNEFLYMRANEITKVITPKPWCSP